MVSRLLLTFPSKISVPSSRASHSWTLWHLKKVPARCTETNYQQRPLSIPDERTPLLLRGGTQNPACKSRIVYFYNKWSHTDTLKFSTSTEPILQLTCNLKQISHLRCKFFEYFCQVLSFLPLLLLTPLFSFQYFEWAL